MDNIALLANITLNAILCDSLGYFADILEQSSDIEKTVREIVANTYKEHKRIIMNGNNYSKEWHEEAKRRGLPEFSNAVDAISVWLAPETAELFGRFDIFSEIECHSRYEIALENFIKIWVRKEAYVKAAGKTVAEFPNFSVVDGARFVKKIHSIAIKTFAIKFED